MKTFPRLLAVCAAALCAAAPLRADDTIAQVITKARARIGTEAALAKVTAVRYQGAIAIAGSNDLPISLDVIFQSPYRMLQRVTSAKGTEVLALDGYEGWAMSLGPKSELIRGGNLSADAIARHRASVWENLSFFSGIELVNGSIEDGGTVTLDGQPARKLVFRHGTRAWYARWFDPATGRLIQSETEDGTIIREEGELLAADLRFPKKLINSARKDGKLEVVSTIVFDKVILNDLLPDKAFAPPRPAAAAPAPKPPAPATLTLAPLMPLPKATPSSSSSNITLPTLPPPPTK